MPLEPRAPDNFTVGNLGLGFSRVEFAPRDPATGALLTPIDIGILSAQELAKEVTVIQALTGEAGTVSVARELVSQLIPSFNLTTYNLRADVAQLIFAAESLTEVVANAAQPVVNEPIVVPGGDDATRIFTPLQQADIDPTPANLTLTAAPVVNELVGTGDGTSGTTNGDFALAYKPNVFGDVTRVERFDAAGVSQEVYTVIAAGAPSAGEVAVTGGTGADSGDLQFQANIPNGHTIRADYAPTHNMEEDETAAAPDMHLDSLLGRIRFPKLDSAASKSAGPLLRQGQTAQLSYQYNRKAGFDFRPFTQGGLTFAGQATIKHLPDVGINFVWTVPQASIRLTDDALTFGADDFIQAVLSLQINDGGGQDRYGTIRYASEAQAAG